MTCKAACTEQPYVRRKSLIKKRLDKKLIRTDQNQSTKQLRRKAIVKNPDIKNRKKYITIRRKKSSFKQITNNSIKLQGNKYVRTQKEAERQASNIIKKRKRVIKI